jgi:hypothetical protein
MDRFGIMLHENGDIAPTIMLQELSALNSFIKYLPGVKVIRNLLLTYFQQIVQPKLKAYFELLAVLDGSCMNVDCTFAVQKGLRVIKTEKVCLTTRLTDLALHSCPITLMCSC